MLSNIVLSLLYYSVQRFKVMLIKIIYTFSKLEAEVSPCSLFSVLKLKAMLIYTLLPEIETNKKLSCI